MNDEVENLCLGKKFSDKQQANGGWHINLWGVITNEQQQNQMVHQIFAINHEKSTNRVRFILNPVEVNLVADIDKIEDLYRFCFFTGGTVLMDDFQTFDISH